MTATTEIRDRLKALGVERPDAFNAIREAWPHTLATLDEPDDAVVEIPVRGGPPIRKTAGALRAQLLEHIGEVEADGA